MFHLGNQNTTSFDVYCTFMHLSSPQIHFNVNALRSHYVKAAFSSLNAKFSSHFVLRATFWTVTKEMKTLGFLTTTELYLLSFILLFTQVT